MKTLDELTAAADAQLRVEIARFADDIPKGNSPLALAAMCEQAAGLALARALLSTGRLGAGREPELMRRALGELRVTHDTLGAVGKTDMALGVERVRACAARVLERRA